MTSFGSQIETNSQPDTIFFLLKSAVPVARMVKQLWPALYPDTPIPNIRYINIGREKKSEVEYSYNFKTFQAGKTYSPPVIHAPEIESIQDHYGDTIGNRVLIVDEYSESGRTISTAQLVLEEAYPDAEIATKVVYSEMPYWQNQPNFLGIEDSDQYAIENLALERVNSRFGTNFESFTDFMGDPRKTQFIEVFDKYIDYYTNAPHFAMANTNIVDHVRNNPPHSPGFLDSPHVQEFIEGRKEVDEICKRVLEKAKESGVL
jgi:hypoxanthine phosphoribosyltransferase